MPSRQSLMSPPQGMSTLAPSAVGCGFSRSTGSFAARQPWMPTGMRINVLVAELPGPDGCSQGRAAVRVCAVEDKRGVLVRRQVVGGKGQLSGVRSAVGDT